jgi:hypothetical protein
MCLRERVDESKVIVFLQIEEYHFLCFAARVNGRTQVALHKPLWFFVRLATLCLYIAMLNGMEEAMR